MGTKPNDGGLAFPRASEHHWNLADQGMSLRDWFAGMALQGLLAESTGEDISCFEDYCQDIADSSYAYADAMLEERASVS